MMSGYMWAVMWFALAAYLFYNAFKGNRFLFIIAPFFLFLGGWSLADELLEVDLMQGAYSLVYRGVAVAMLIICMVKYYRSKKDK